MFKISESFFILFMLFSFQFSLAGQTISPVDQKLETDRTDAYAAQLENYLRQYLVDDYNARASIIWNRDYSSIDAFVRSVEPNRER
jgi:hypothetical protein